MDYSKGMETMAVTKRFRKTNGKKRAVYQAEVYVQGIRVQSRQFDTQAAAYTWHDETKASYESNPSKSSPLRPMSFKECLEAYSKSEDFTRLRLSSRQSRSVRFRHFQESPISTIKMSELKAEHIDEWLTWLKTSPTAQNPGRKSFDHEIRVLTIILNWYKNEVHPGFEVPVVRRHRERSEYKEVTPRRADYFIQPEDIQLWLQTLQKAPNPTYFQLAQFLVLTGARLGEAAGLQWDCIDLSKRVATVRRTLAWDHHTRQPYIQDRAKNEESLRLLRLPPQLVEMLRVMKMSAKSAVVFADRTQGFLRDNGIRSALNKAFKKAQLPWTATRILRHTFATWNLMASNSDISAVQVAMGHKRRTTTEIYAKPLAALTGEVVDAGAEMMMRPRHVQNHVHEEIFH